MAATDAKLFPQRAVAIRVTVPLYDSTGALVTGGAGLAGSISKDGAAFGATTNAPVEIAAASGLYTLDLTAAEMTADTVAVKVSSSTVGAKITPVVMYTVANPPVQSLRRATAAAGAALSITLDASASASDNFYNEQTITLISGTGSGQSRVITGYVGATKVATVSRAWTVVPDSTSVFMTSSGADVWDQNEGAEPSGAIPDGTSFRLILQYLKRRFYNKVTQTSLVQTVYKDNSATVLTNMGVSTTSTTQTKGKTS